MKSKLFAVASLAVMMFVASCGQKETDAQTDDTDRLFDEILKLTASYCSLLERETDSLRAVELFDRFNFLLDSLNNSVASNTDLLFTEEENDTLFAKVMKVRCLYEEAVNRQPVADTIDLTEEPEDD